jgi:site-specific recombinase XerD
MDKQTVKVVAKEFYRYLDNEKGAAFNTMRAYRGDVEDFVRFVSEGSFEVVDHETIRAYIVHVYTGLKKSSLARKVSAIKMFFRFMKKKGYIDENTALIIRSPRIEKLLPKFYTIDEMFHFLDFLPGRMAQYAQQGHLRAHVFLWHEGERGPQHGQGRPSPRGHVGAGDGKGGKERILPFGEKAKEALEEYLAAVGMMDKFAANKALFINVRASASHTGAC